MCPATSLVSPSALEKWDTASLPTEDMLKSKLGPNWCWPELRRAGTDGNAAVAGSGLDSVDSAVAVEPDIRSKSGAVRTLDTEPAGSQKDPGNGWNAHGLLRPPWEEDEQGCCRSCWQP